MSLPEELELSQVDLEPLSKYFPINSSELLVPPQRSSLTRVLPPSLLDHKRYDQIANKVVVLQMAVYILVLLGLELEE